MNLANSGWPLASAYSLLLKKTQADPSVSGLLLPAVNVPFSLFSKAGGSLLNFSKVVSALWTSVYLPWGRGTAMGTLSFLLCVARIITAVLLVILSPTVSRDNIRLLQILLISPNRFRSVWLLEAG